MKIHRYSCKVSGNKKKYQEFKEAEETAVMEQVFKKQECSCLKRHKKIVKNMDNGTVRMIKNQLRNDNDYGLLDTYRFRTTRIL